MDTDSKKDLIQNLENVSEILDEIRTETFEISQIEPPADSSEILCRFFGTFFHQVFLSTYQFYGTVCDFYLNSLNYFIVSTSKYWIV